MAWTYSPTDLNTTTDEGRLNSVRLLIGDTVLADPQLQDEEITFALSQTGNNNVYTAAAWCCRIIAAKYSRMVTTQLDGVLESLYSDRIKHYALLAQQISELGKSATGRGLGVSGGGISITEMNTVSQNPDRPVPAFRRGQFSYLEDDDHV